MAPANREPAAPAPSTGEACTAEENRLIRRATHLMAASLFAGLLTAFAVFNAFAEPARGIMAAGPTLLILGFLVPRLLFWRWTRPLARHALGESPRFERVRQVARLDFWTPMMVILVLLAAQAKVGWPVVVAIMIAATAFDMIATHLLTRWLTRLNASEAGQAAAR